jgi:ABC-type taurine transport system ATPase subunit
MATDQVRVWQELAAAMQIEVVAPCGVVLDDGMEVRATAHVTQFGAARGMIVDPLDANLMPYADALTNCGYGYSVVSIDDHWDRSEIIDMLADWGWSSREPAPPWLGSDT